MKRQNDSVKVFWTFWPPKQTARLQSVFRWKSVSPADKLIFTGQVGRSFHFNVTACAEARQLVQRTFWPFGPASSLYMLAGWYICLFEKAMMANFMARPTWPNGVRTSLHGHFPLSQPHFGTCSMLFLFTENSLTKDLWLFNTNYDNLFKGIREGIKNPSHGKCPWWGGYPPFSANFFR